MTPPAPADAAHRELADRVLDSATFERSRRLRAFLAFLCDRVLADPDAPFGETEIAAAVFGRKGEIDASTSALIRVQASQLRKKLQQYFAIEGAAEPIVIELTTATYRPVFRERSALTDAPGAAVSFARLPMSALTIAMGVVLVAAIVALVADDLRLRRQAGRGAAVPPAVGRLWRQMFDNGRRTHVVLADSSITMFQDLIHMPLPADRYATQDFDGLIAERVPAALQTLARRLTRQRYTSMADVALVRRVLPLAADLGVPAEVMLARDAKLEYLRTGNTLLSGPRRANPWLELFEERLNFRSRFDQDQRASYFENRAPQAGEQPVYAVQWDARGFCHVAFLPSLNGAGSVLIVSGTDMSSGEAGIDALTDEGWVEQLRSKLGVRGEERTPYFELLLGTQIVGSAASRGELVAARVVRPPAP